MSGEAGTRMPEHEINYGHCGTGATGWLNGKHPNEDGQIVDRQVCFTSGGNSCNWNIQVQVIKCDVYFLYYLEDTPACNLRYCSE